MIGPSPPTLPHRVSLRCRIQFEEEQKLLRLYGLPLHVPESHFQPVNITFSPKLLQTGGAGEVSLSLHLPALSAHDIMSLRKASKAASGGAVASALTLEGIDSPVNIASLLPMIESLMPEWLDDDVLQFLCELSPSTMLPWCFYDEVFAWLRETSGEERLKRVQEFQQAASENKATIPTLSLRIAVAGDQDYYEEFLGFFPRLKFVTPRIQETATFTQSDADAMWNDPAKSARISAVFSEDIAAMADDVRKWAANEGKGCFPFSFSNEAPSSPVVKTYLAWERLPVIDRLWYFERPMILRLRPVSREEHWEIQEQFFRSKGDLQRADFSADRLAEIKRGKPNPDSAKAESSVPAVTTEGAFDVHIDR